MKIEFYYNDVQFVVDPAKHQILINGQIADGIYAPVGGIIVDVDVEDPEVCKVITDADNAALEKIIVYGAPLRIGDKVIILDKYVIPAEIFVGNNSDILSVVAVTGNYNDLINKPKINGEVLEGDIEIGGGSGTSGTTDYNKLKNLPSINGQKLVGDVEIAIPKNVGELFNDKNYISKSEAPVTSVNGYIGKVQLTAADVDAMPADKKLTAADVGALPKDTKIPQKISDITDGTDVVLSVNGKTGHIKIGDGTGEDTGGGTWNYAELVNLPKINDVELKGTLTLAALNIMPADKTFTAEDVGALPDTTVIPKTAADVGALPEDTKIPKTAADVGALPKDTKIPTKVGELTNDKNYISAAEAPVTSVNGRTGAVQLTAAEVGALSNNTKIFSETEIRNIVKGTKFKDIYNATTNSVVLSINGQSGNVTLSLPKGEKGDVGDSTYDLYYKNEISAGRSPLSLEKWLEAQKGQDGEDGKDGHGLDFDAAGNSLADRAQYDNEPQGFKFAYTVSDQSSGKSTVYIYSKISDASGAWSSALVIEFFGVASGGGSSNININEPLTIPGRSVNAAYLMLTMDIPNGCISAISTVSDGGEEEFLPLFSDYGIQRISRKGNKFTLYYGKNCPSFASGRIYLSQLVSDQKITGNAVNGGTISEKMYYGYAVDGLTSSVTQMNSVILDTALQNGTMTEFDVAAEEASIAVPEGAFLVVLVPENYWSVQKFNGINGWTTFYGEDYGGANGDIVNIGSRKYRVYGEFKDSKTTIKIKITYTGV